MGILSGEDFAQNIHPGHIYRFVNASIGTVPHYFICVSQTDYDDFEFICCTSQFNTLDNYISKNLYEPTSVVHFSPNPETNGFILDTYANCNQIFSYTRSQIKSMYDNQTLSHTGNLDDAKHYEVQLGILKSSLIDVEEKERLRQGFEKQDDLDYEID